ncbi:MAG: rhodanese-related sulfurtransferase, partial [Ignavibacteria bacterium]
MKSNLPYRVLLYYKYVYLDDHENYAKLHLNFCRSLGIKGRILIAEEGINGTLSGTEVQTKAYMYAMKMDSRFKDLDFKIDHVNEHAFKKMYVRVKKELVTFNSSEDINPNKLTGIHLKPKEFLEAMKEENVIILDARNDYEYDLGHFKNAVKPDVRNFKEFPEWIKKNKDKFSGKKV